MAKTVGSACAQIAIILTICGSIYSVQSISSTAYLHSSLGAQLPYIQPDYMVLLPADQVQRHRRAADVTTATEATPTQNLKNHYQSVSSNATGDATVTTVDGKVAGNTGSVTYNVRNVGVNGTGQRKDLTSGNPTTGKISTTSINTTAVVANSSAVSMPAAASVPGAPAAPAAPVVASVPAAPGMPSSDAQPNPPKKTQLMASQPAQFPKKVIATAAGGAATATERSIIDEIDVPEEVITKEAANQTLKSQEDHFDYYRSRMYVNKEETDALWTQMRQIPENNLLSSSHRRAMTVELTFDFPFYGHIVRNVTVATGGFLYTGEYVHSWLAATQYIAPLMANFDTSLSDDSFVRLLDNGTALTVVWENVTLQDKLEYGNFTFSATLHQNGDIIFAYYNVPTLISQIQDSHHPVKVGLSDAYIVDKALMFARRKTIYEYHRVTLGQTDITNSTIVMLTALPTCLKYTDCQSCMKHETTFQCAWCPTLNRCSTNTGNDRRKQDWQQKGCQESYISQIDKCPALGTRGNNAAQLNGGNSGANNTSSRGNTTPAAGSDSRAGGGAVVTEATISSTQSSVSGGAASESEPKIQESEHVESMILPNDKHVGVAFGFMVPICLVFAVTLWLFYAYRNPHTRSGQLLIQFRPSQWSWRRGEARYTAATIHM